MFTANCLLQGSSRKKTSQESRTCQTLLLV